MHQSIYLLRLDQSIYVSPLSINLYHPIYASIYLPSPFASIYLCLTPSLCPSMNVSISIYQPLDLSIYLCLCVFMYISVYLSFYRSIYLSFRHRVDQHRQCKSVHEVQFIPKTCFPMMFSIYVLKSRCFFLICFATPDLQNNMNQ